MTKIYKTRQAMHE